MPTPVGPMAITTIDSFSEKEEVISITVTMYKYREVSRRVPVNPCKHLQCTVSRMTPLGLKYAQEP